jgi:hypothetical protein
MPPGEAPEEVRRAWVGLSVPVTEPESRLRDQVKCFGVRSGPHGIVRQLWALFRGRFETWRGYSIESRKCIEHLRAHDAVAAAWWVDNCPRFMEPKCFFVFPAECCELLGEDGMPKDLGAGERRSGSRGSASKTLGMRVPEISVVPASQRFSATSLSTEIVDGRALASFALYECPTCEHGIRFKRDDLEQAAEVTVLSQTDASAMDSAARLRDVRGAFLDWYCQGCHAPRRVYCRPWAGGRHGDHGVEVQWVLEAASGACDDD